jgi:hypothetical protein
MSLYPKIKIEQKRKICQVLVAHNCNPRYLEAEIGRIAVGGQSRQIVWKTLS